MASNQIVAFKLRGESELGRFLDSKVKVFMVNDIFTDQWYLISPITVTLASIPRVLYWSCYIKHISFHIKRESMTLLELGVTPQRCYWVKIYI